MPYRRPGGGGGAPAQAFAADTSGAPVTITLPALDGLEDGYIVRVYDSGSNAATNNITINDADAAELDVIDEDDGERWLVVVGGAWEVRGYLPVPPGLATAATWTDLPTTGTEGASAYLEDAGIALRWAGAIDPLDADGRRWVPASLYDETEGIAGATSWLEAADLTGADTDPITSWPDRVTGAYSAAGGARPTVDADGGPTGEVCAVFDGVGDYMASSNLAIARNLGAATLLMVARPTSGSAKQWYHASNAAGTITTRFGAYGAPGAVACYFRPGDGSQAASVSSVQALNTWGLLAYHAVGGSNTNGLPARAPDEVDVYAALGATGSTPDTDSDVVWLGAYDSGGGTPADTFAGGVACVLVLGGSSRGQARDAAAWLQSRFAL